MTHDPLMATVEHPGIETLRPFDVARARKDFPALEQTVKAKPLVYLDNAASAQKPRQVIEALADAYTFDYSNVHRGVHTLSQHATDAYEHARRVGQRFLGAARSEEIIFVRGVTEAINLVASSFVRPRLTPGDEVVLSTMEHHSNIVPWQLICEQVGARLRVVPINDLGEIDLDLYRDSLSQRTRMVALVHVSNAIGTINPVREMVAIAHQHSLPVLLDGAQAAPHLNLDVQDLDCDFYAVSGHKMFGPTGIGLLYGKHEYLSRMIPYQGGGEMIRSVSFEKTEYADLPHRFEAGTPHIVGAIGLAAAIEYLQTFDPAAIIAHEHDLLGYATERLAKFPQVEMVGRAENKAAVVSFVVKGVHAHDVGTILDSEGIAVRAGHHCAQPLMERLGVTATARASFAFYNTRDEVDRLVDGVEKVLEIFG